MSQHKFPDFWCSQTVPPIVQKKLPCHYTKSPACSSIKLHYPNRKHLTLGPVKLYHNNRKHPAPGPVKLHQCSWSPQRTVKFHCHRPQLAVQSSSTNQLMAQSNSDVTVQSSLHTQTTNTALNILNQKTLFIPQENCSNPLVLEKNTPLHHTNSFQCTG